MHGVLVQTVVAYRRLWESVLNSELCAVTCCLFLVRVEVCLPLVLVLVGNLDMIP